MPCRERISETIGALAAQRGSRGIALLAAFAVAVVAAALAPFVAYGAGAPPHKLSARSWSGGDYGWPVKPFHRQHPVRGNFGDPRTIFAAPPTSRALLNGSVLSHFHYGIDICARPGTAVYPVRAGVVTGVSTEHGLERVTVASQAGRSFVYTHVAPAVAVGQMVEAEATVLGHVTRANHVDLSVSRNGVLLNPLGPGEIAPYRDRTRPVVDSIAIRAAATNREVLTNFVHGRVRLLATAHDTPSIQVAGAWAGLPVTPALVTWRIQRWAGRVAVPRTVAWDVRSTLPSDADFWNAYARGTFQNMAVFGPHYSYGMGGVYVFKLGDQFDTRRLRDGIYDLVVTAADVRGNRSSRAMRLYVQNRKGWSR